LIFGAYFAHLITSSSEKRFCKADSSEVKKMSVVPLNSVKHFSSNQARPRTAQLNLNVRGLHPSATLAIN
jgi:hypothetical protein